MAAAPWLAGLAPAPVATVAVAVTGVRAPAPAATAVAGVTGARAPAPVATAAVTLGFGGDYAALTVRFELSVVRPAAQEARDW